MSFLGIPSFEDIGKYVEAEYIKPPKEWQDMVASFLSELRERYYSTLGSEGAEYLQSGLKKMGAFFGGSSR